MSARIEELRRQARMLSAAELAEAVKVTAKEIRATPSERYRAEQVANLAVFTAEIERREAGGVAETDTRVPAMTDGERAASGLEPKDRAP